MSEKTALIFDIARNSCVDGPGLRTTVFFKGCNLRCLWCHNPESHSFRREVFFYESKCRHCGQCRGISSTDADFVCENGAREICGKEFTPESLLPSLLRDKLFYEASGGGVTFSGGECMLQVDFLEKVLRLCKAAGIHTAVDTAGHVPYQSFEQILPFTDLILYDIKSFYTETHRRCTGAGNELILENLKKLLQAGIPLWVRVPIIPGINDSPTEIALIRSFLDRWGMPQRVELLPYHAMAAHKYAALGKPAPAFSVPSEEAMLFLRSHFEP